MFFGVCYFVVVVKFEMIKYYKIVMSYVYIVEVYFKLKGIDVELIKLNGFVELVCVVDMVDGIVDIV